jgi:hypothetical protein
MLRKVMDTAHVTAEDVEALMAGLRAKAEEQKRLVDECAKAVKAEQSVQAAAGLIWPYCSTCTFKNTDEGATKCGMCGTPRDECMGGHSGSNKKKDKEKNRWSCPHCGSTNKTSNSSGSGSGGGSGSAKSAGAAPPKCSTCHLTNHLLSPGLIWVQDMDSVEAAAASMPPAQGFGAAGVGMAPSPATPGTASLAAAKAAVRRQGPYVAASVSTLSIREELQELLAGLQGDGTGTLAQAKARLARKVASMPASTTGQVHHHHQYGEGEEEYDDEEQDY